MRSAWVVAALLVLGALCFVAYDVLSVPRAVQRRATNQVGAQATERARTGDPAPPTRPKEVQVSRPARRTPRQQFFETTDLADFVASQAANANQGDGQAALYIAKAYQECMPFGKDPNAYAGTMREIVKPLFRSTNDVQAFDAMMRREVSRCSALNQSTERQKTMQDWLRRGAEQGNLSARIARLATAQSVPSGEMQDILEQLVRSKDGEAIGEIGPMMGLTSADELTTFKKPLKKSREMCFH